MSQPHKRKTIMYTSNYCTHSRAVEVFMMRHHIPIKMINIDENESARKKVLEINDGYASVPTLVFPNGDTLTEPSMRQLRDRLNIQRPSFWEHLKTIFR